MIPPCDVAGFHYAISAEDYPMDLLFFLTSWWNHGQNCFSNRRSWCKLHLAVDVTSGESLTSAVTTHKVRDWSLVPDLLGSPL